MEELERCQQTSSEFLRTGKYTLASEVDHVFPHRNDQALFYDPLDLQSLCTGLLAR